MLEALHKHGFWKDSFCGWQWDTPSGTRSILDSLVKRGLATVTNDKYTITEKGSALLVASCKTHYPSNNGRCVYCGHQTNDD